jgi:two-component system response regulator AtoC
LRERREDIPFLLGHFMTQMAKHYNLPPRNISPVVVEACQSHSWPGNLKEFQTFVKCCLLAGEDEILLSELSHGLMQHEVQECSSEPTKSQADVFGNQFQESISGLKFLVQSAKGLTERNAIANALSKTQWNRKAAARLLKVSYRTLLYKIERYQMSPPVSHFPAPRNGVGKQPQGN